MWHQKTSVFQVSWCSNWLPSLLISEIYVALSPKRDPKPGRQHRTRTEHWLKPATNENMTTKSTYVQKRYCCSTPKSLSMMKNLGINYLSDIGCSASLESLELSCYSDVQNHSLQPRTGKLLSYKNARLILLLTFCHPYSQHVILLVADK